MDNNIFNSFNQIAEDRLESIKNLLAVELGEANFRIIRARIRGGKVQRKKKVSTRPGYTFRNKKLIRMTSGERLRRRRGARKGKVKRKAKRARILMKTKRSLRKRASLGV